MNLGVTESITSNGIHYGVSISDQGFDNLSTRGMQLTEWLADFHCPSEEFIIETLDDFGRSVEMA
jgi:hypothetical protein